MYNFYSYVIVTVLVLSAVGFAIGGPSFCYYCNTEADGDACNTPLNTTAVRVQICSNSSIVNGTDAVLSTGNVDDSVCTILRYNRGSGQTTIRGCENREVSNRELCPYLTATLTSSVSDFVCETCETDLCNSSSAAHISIFVLLFMGLRELF